MTQKCNGGKSEGDSDFPNHKRCFRHGLYQFCCFFKIYFRLRWVFVAAHGLSLVAGSGGYSLLQCTGLSLQWLLLLQSTGSRHAAFSSCSMWAQ